MMKKNKILALVAGCVCVGGILFCQFSYKKETTSVREIKKQFEQKQENLAPVYNVNREAVLCFSFALDYTYIEELRVDGLEMVSVHTAPDCGKDSKVECYVWEEEKAGATIIYASPVMPAYATESLADVERVWGSAPIYYACIRYDMESAEPDELEAPMVIPFTVTSACEVPNVIGTVDDSGNLVLSWDAVEGADKYTIYQHFGEGIWIEKVGNTSETSYTVQTEDKVANVSAYQNQGVLGSYYVTAHVSGMESNLSAAVDTKELPLPQKFLEEIPYGQVYESVERLPEKVQVINTDESIMWRSMLYQLREVDEYAIYDFTVDGTSLTGTVCVTKQLAEFPEVIEQVSDLAYLEHNTQLNKVPSMAVKSVIAQTETDGALDQTVNNIDLYQTALAQTRQWMMEGEEETVVKPFKGCKLFADNAAEAWLSYHLLAAEHEIPLQAFPDMLNPYVLEDTFLKVCYQNPYVLGVKSYYFDYEKLTLHVEYAYSEREIQKRQKQLYKEATEIVSSIIKDDMAQEEKAETIYLWLEEHCVYASKEWEYLKEQEFQKDERWTEFEDCNYAYGAIVKGEALCGGYASAYQLLCHMADVKAITVNGYLNGNIPHAWNMIYLDGNWYQIDCSSNKNTTGIPFYLYGADQKSAEARGYVLGSDFAKVRECGLLQQQNRDNQKEYYLAHRLEVATIAEIEWLLTKYLDEDSVAFRCEGISVEEEELIEIVRKVYLKHGKEAELENLSYQQLGQYIMVYKK